MSDYLGLTAPQKLGIFRYGSDWTTIEEDLKCLNEDWKGLVNFSYEIKGE